MKREFTVNEMAWFINNCIRLHIMRDMMYRVKYSPRRARHNV